MKLFTKPKDFFQMLKEQAKSTEVGIRLLLEFVNSPNEIAARRVNEAEDRADELRRILVEALNESFITPIDREDIFAVSRVIDDMIDYAKSTVAEMILFKVETNQYLKRMAEALCESAENIYLAVSKLKDDPKSASQHIMKAKKIENLVEHIYREALVDLFQNPDVITILKLREIYRHLSNAADRGDEAANIIGDILVKIT
ncbi:MAG: DUF47 family protein [Elusimicrobiota bacterium]